MLLFVPNEAAFHAAIVRDAGLYEEAFRQGVVVCSPTTLLAALRLIAHVWRSEKQNANAQRIADEAGKLLDKLSDFVGDLDRSARGSIRRRRASPPRGRSSRPAAGTCSEGGRPREARRAGEGEKVHPLLLDAGEEEEEEEDEDEDAPPALLPAVVPATRSS